MSTPDDPVSAFQSGDLERARVLAERRLAAGEAEPRLQHLMGLIDCRSGKLESGIGWLMRACEAEPDNAAYRVMLVRALADSGRAREAFEAASPPTGTTPPELALWHARAEAATAVSAWPEAAEAWSKLCSIGLGDWRAWSNLADALGNAGRWRESARALEQAVKLNPGELQLRRNFAGALNNAGRHHASVEQFRRCIEAAPNDRSLRISIAPILADLGRDDEAEAELNKAAELAGVRDVSAGLIAIVIDDDSVDVLALSELADFLERSGRMVALDQLLEDARQRGVAPEEIGFAAAAAALRAGDAIEAKRLLLTELPSSRPVRWHWLMARIADKLGDSDLAFAEFEAMNRSARGYDFWLDRSDKYLEGVRRVSVAISPDWSKRVATLPPPPRSAPAFIVGFPRSGTTLLDTFLMGHPDTAVLEEVPVIHAVESRLGEASSLPDRSAAELEQARNAYFAELDRHLDLGFGGLAVDKLPLNMIAAPFIHCLFPSSPILFVQRHPCDAVLSCFMQGFALNDPMACFLEIGRAASFYDAAMSVWTRSRENLGLNCHTVVYEELIADPEAALRPAIAFLGLEWRQELLDHRATALTRGRISTPSYSQVTQPLTLAAAGRWKRYEKQLAPVLPVLLPWAERLGYSD